MNDLDLAEALVKLHDNHYRRCVNHDWEHCPNVETWKNLRRTRSFPPAHHHDHVWVCDICGVTPTLLADSI